MADNFIRIRNYRNYLPDGKSYVEYECTDKDEVFVALLMGMEPKTIKDKSDFLDVDEIVLRMANHIRKAREQSDTDQPEKNK